MGGALLGCALLTVALTVNAAGERAPDRQAAGLSAAQQTAYALAVASFREHHYAAAYGRFVRLADAGHAPSAQLALVMYRNGPALFGSEWDATPEQLEHWNALVIQDEQDR
ncbi:MAG TPA: hypothetical protein VMG60_11360 [Burkholderiaceae bacterium]|nr:hypothetical protein [Burkholderiaceae bacterium]